MCVCVPMPLPLSAQRGIHLSDTLWNRSHPLLDAKKPLGRGFKRDARGRRSEGQGVGSHGYPIRHPFDLHWIPLCPGPGGMPIVIEPLCDPPE